MDLYGKLNNEIVKKEYAGSTTDTAKTIVDNNSNVIKTEVKRVPGKLTVDYYKDGELVDFIYDGSEDKKIHIPQVADFERLQEDVDRLDTEINGDQPEGIVNQISELKQADINEAQARLNADKRLESLISAEETARIHEIDRLESEIQGKASQSDLSTLSSQVGSLNSQIESLNSNVAQANTKIEENTTSITNLQNEIGQINDLLTNIDSGEGV